MRRPPYFVIAGLVPAIHRAVGHTHLFLVGKYLDKLKIENGEAKFLEREVRLDTRRLDKGSHWPI